MVRDGERDQLSLSILGDSVTRIKYVDILLMNLRDGVDEMSFII